jgi:hypothetical protein
MTQAASETLATHAKRSLDDFMRGDLQRVERLIGPES